MNIAAQIIARRASRAATASTGFLIFDTESIPNGELIARTCYPDEQLPPEEAIERARAEARAASRDGTDFLPVTYQLPVAVCVIRVATDFTLQRLACLGAPEYHTADIVKQFWRGVEHYSNAKLVTFNGRCFDLPLMELAAFDQRLSIPQYLARCRNRFQSQHIDLMDWLSNYGAFRLTGGLNLLAKRGLVPPGCGKMEVAGDLVYEMYRQGKRQEINDYCLFDTLDTYFVFLRTRLMLGEFDACHEDRLYAKARAFLVETSADFPALKLYLRQWDRTRQLPSLLTNAKLSHEISLSPQTECTG